jgi:hypothetical protein
MKRTELSALWGVLLIAGGVLFLLQSLDIVGHGAGLVVALLFGAGGITFVYLFLRNRAQWWAVIPGFALLGLATLMVAEQVLPGKLGGMVGGPIFLGALGLSFWVIYLNQRDHWWAIIPGGVLLTLAAVASADAISVGMDTGSVFFLGLGATFALLYVLPTPEGRIRWAIIPAAVMLILGVVIAAQQAVALRYLWPLALILVGLLMVWRTISARRRE